MGQGSSPSAAGGGTPEGGMGLGILGSLFGAGTQNPGGGPSPGTSSNLITQLGTLIKDPKVLQALADVTKNLGKAIESGDKVPAPHAAEMIKALSGPQQGQGSPLTGSGPFLGDIANFTPQQAQSLLQAMGIPGGFTPLTSRG